MKIFSCEKIKKIDAYTIENEPIKSIDLMERAATQLFDWIIKRYYKDSLFTIFAGPGNNGGDGLALARLLAGKGYSVRLFYLDTDKYSDDFNINMKRLIEQGKITPHAIKTSKDFPHLHTLDLIVDALFGSGLSRPLDGIASELVKHLNQAKNNEIISVDIPSGLFGEDNSKNDRDSIIRATQTLSLHFPKLSFYFAENDEYVGDWEVLPIGLHPDIIEKTPTEYRFLPPVYAKTVLRKRDKFSHKGTYGHGLLISGSYGKMGAAVMASKSAMRTGLGLLTIHIPGSGNVILQTANPECMVSVDVNDDYFTEVPELDEYKAVGVGPGIGTSDETISAFEDLLDKIDSPMVIDADALNILGLKKELLKKVPEKSILTPHFKEFERIAGESDNCYSRNLKQIDLSKEYKVYIVLKGANTAITCPDGSCFFNTTGNPGMATAGSGDVLTGMILSLLTQGYSPDEAALTGVYLHGLAGDIAETHLTQHSMIAGDITTFIPDAYKRLI